MRPLRALLSSLPVSEMYYFSALLWLPAKTNGKNTMLLSALCPPWQPWKGIFQATLTICSSKTRRGNFKTVFLVFFLDRQSGKENKVSPKIPMFIQALVSMCPLSCEWMCYYTGNGGFVGVTGLRTLKWRDYAGLIGWTSLWWQKFQMRNIGTWRWGGLVMPAGRSDL